MGRDLKKLENENGENSSYVGLVVDSKTKNLLINEAEHHKPMLSLSQLVRFKLKNYDEVRDKLNDIRDMLLNDKLVTKNGLTEEQLEMLNNLKLIPVF